ncbi:MAG: hypothetical protein IT349_15925 [Candidatus Eisenbacteria bacterium]|nr:hypothetical protein [Candidatus Eisenbacteria bacterium]
MSATTPRRSVRPCTPAARVAPTALISSVALFALLLASSGLERARADLTIESRTESQGVAFLGDMSSTETTYLAGTKQAVVTSSKMNNPFFAQAGMSGEISTLQITRLDRELQWTIDEREGSYTEMLFSTLRAMLGSFADAFLEAGVEGDIPETDVDVVRGSERRTIAGLQAEKVTLTVKGNAMDDSGGPVSTRWTMELWLATGANELHEAQEFQKAMARAIGVDPSQSARMMQMFDTFGGGLKALSAKMQGLDGYPLESTMRIETTARDHADRAESGHEVEVSGTAPGAPPRTTGLGGVPTHAGRPPSADGYKLMLEFRNVVERVDTSPIPADRFELPTGLTRLETPSFTPDDTH